MNQKTKCCRLMSRLTGVTLRTIVIRAGFPWHKSPSLYQWMWVFILLPFLEDDSLNGLIEKHGAELRELYKILIRHADAFENLLRILTMPFFLNLWQISMKLTKPVKAAGESELFLTTPKLKKLANIWNSYTNFLIMQKIVISWGTTTS